MSVFSVHRTAELSAKLDRSHFKLCVQLHIVRIFHAQNAILAMVKIVYCLICLCTRCTIVGMYMNV